MPSAIAFRIATAFVALAVLNLTHGLLSSADFQVFNVILFALALCSAITSPVNRFFWAHNDRTVYVNSIHASLAAVLIISLLSGILLAVNKGEYGKGISVWLVLFSIPYVTAKIVERYTYGQIMFEGRMTSAFLFPLLAAMSELVALLIQYFIGSPSLVLRLTLTVGFFLAVVAAFGPARAIALSLATQVSLRTLSDFVKRTTISTIGLLTVVLFVSSTLAAMIDRLVIVVLHGLDDAFKADYLLALSYAIAIQTLMTALIDVGRRRVFSHDRWIAGARSFAAAALLLTVFAWFFLIVLLPAYKWAGVMPETIDIFIWAGLISKSLVLVLINFCNVDFVQRGNVGRLIPYVLLIAVASAVFLLGLASGVPAPICSLILIVPSLLLSIHLVISFWGRISEARRECDAI